MTRRTLLATSLVLACFARNALAQAAAASAPAALRCEGRLVLDSTDASWRAVAAQYARLDRAMMARNADSLFAVYSPDFEAVQTSGALWRFKDAAAYSRAGFEQVREQLHISNVIVALHVCDDRATATVLQQWSRRQFTKGAIRRFDTAAVQDETWIRTPQGWLRRFVDRVHPGAWYVDDKRVATNQPYDPGAPPYDPEGFAGLSREITPAHQSPP